MALNEKDKNNENNSPEEDEKPYQPGEELNDEKFYSSIKDCIENIKKNWNNESKKNLKNIIAKFQKTENVFTYRRYLKEPFKSILTNFLLYIMNKKNLKEEDILKLAEPIIDKSWNMDMVKDDKKLLGKKTERSKDSSGSSSSESEDEDKKEKNESDKDGSGKKEGTIKS